MNRGEPNNPLWPEGRESEVLAGGTAEPLPAGDEPPLAITKPPPEGPEPPSAVTEPLRGEAAGLPQEADLSAEHAPHDPYAAFRVPAYRLYVTSFVLAIVGSQSLSAAAIFDVDAKTGSPLMVGMIGLANAIPLLTLAMPAGHVADSFSRKRVLIATQAVLVACPLFLAFWHTLPAVFSMLVVNAVALTFGRPARASILPNLVPKSVFTNAVTWNSSFFELATSIAQATSGFIIAALGVQYVYLLSGISMGLCLLLTCFLPDVRPAGRREPMSWRTLSAGLRFVTTRRLVLAPMLLDLIAVILSSATVLIPAFAGMLAGDPQSPGYADRKAILFGWLLAAPSIGAVTMAVAQAHLPPFRRAGRVLLLAVAGYGAATMVFGMSGNFWLSFFMLALTGAFDNVSVVIRHTLVQLITPDSMRGRVSAVNQIFIISSNELGKVESGVAAWLLGPVLAVICGGAATVGLTIGVARRFPELRRLGRLRDIKPAEA